MENVKSLDMKLPMVSVMIPTYNQQRYIVRAIKSALAQNYPNLEIVISDDQSSDATAEVVDQFLLEINDPRVKYFRHERNQGILRNYRMTLYDRVTGDWVINLDGDDFFVDPDFIVEAVQRALSDDRIILVFGNYAEYYEATESFIKIFNRDFPPVMEWQEFFMEFSKDHVRWNHNSILYRRRDAVKIGFYWDEKIPRNDWESFLRLVINHRVGYVENIAAAWSLHDSNETKRLDQAKYLNNYLLIDGIAQLCLDKGIDHAWVRKWKDNMYFLKTKGACIAYVRNRDYSGALQFLYRTGKFTIRLPFKVILNPGFVSRVLLSVSPSLYNSVKNSFLSLKGSGNRNTN